ncbi:MAG TPA: choice-of-anchor tandem repeat GloVer-containing protein [Candidatus Baltobacteraceae bacterium]|nr:choice-of-anchor tandem repeat GloVer-containing protein [Candidatus Baltobacteraceae bacterium]
MNSPSAFQANGAVTENVLHSFTGAVNDGSAPISSLTKAGNLFYGVSGGGGRYGQGTVFSTYPDGTGFKVVYSFQGKQDGMPSTATALTNVGGTLYGTTAAGGAANNGTVFSVTTAGTFKTLYGFKGGTSDGASPQSPLVNVSGTLYGTTFSGGSVRVGNNLCNSCGTLFSVTKGGKEKVLYFFGSVKGDGHHPIGTLAYLNRKFYGATESGGYGSGTIFGATAGGKETVLYTFKNKADGRCNGGYCNLTKLNGTLYGTAEFGGKKHVGSIFSITPQGTFKTLFSASRSGHVFPSAPLLNVNGKFYGTMSDHEVGNGSVFSITTDGTLTTIYKFGGGNDGQEPMSRLFFGNGKLYGTTNKGGGGLAGTIYSITGF